MRSSINTLSGLASIMVVVVGALMSTAIGAKSAFARNQPRNDIVVVFVPGGLGSKLELDGVPVWDSTPTVALRMVMSPALLLPWLRLRVDGPVGSYKSFIDFLNECGFVESRNLLVLTYDWRQGYESLAPELAKEISVFQARNSGKKIVFIAHSYGCIALRKMLIGPLPAGTAQINLGEVERVIVAGPPMLGNATSFHDLLEMTSLSPIFDRAFKLLQQTNPSLANQVQLPIQSTLMAAPAELETMPPRDVRFLMNEGSQGRYSALEWKHWPSELATLRSVVLETQNSIRDSGWQRTPRTLIASDKHPTDLGYVLDAQEQHVVRIISGPGDGTVAIGSAQAFMDGHQPGDETLIVDSLHENLLDDNDARVKIASVITSGGQTTTPHPQLSTVTISQVAAALDTQLEHLSQSQPSVTLTCGPEKANSIEIAADIHPPLHGSLPLNLSPVIQVANLHLPMNPDTTNEPTRGVARFRLSLPSRSLGSGTHELMLLPRTGLPPIAKCRVQLFTRDELQQGKEWIVKNFTPELRSGNFPNN